jgi:hypothetical protein
VGRVILDPLMMVVMVVFSVQPASYAAVVRGFPLRPLSAQVPSSPLLVGGYLTLISSCHWMATGV